VDDAGSLPLDLLSHGPIPQKWTAPGAGTWLLDPSHMPRPLCRFTAAVFPPAFVAGFHDTFARYGVLLEYNDAAVVGGFVYNRLRAVGAPPDAAGLPPEPVFRQLLQDVPALRERVATAEAVFAERRWRGDLRLWDESVKPALLALHVSLRTVDLGALDDGELADHVDRCAQALAEGHLQHHRHNMAAMLPVGDLTVHTMRWTALPPDEVLACLAGASPVTEGAPAQLAALAAALGDEPAAAELVLDPAREPDEVLSRLLRWPGVVAERADAYLSALAALPLDGEDAVGEPGSLEAPGLVLIRLRGALDPQRRPDAERGAEATARVRAAVPEEHRPEFDVLLAEALLVYRLRDERAVYGDRLLGSAARTALLEVGRRLTARGRLGDPADAVDLDPDEVRTLLLEGPGPSAEEVAERVHWRRTADYRDMPPMFGPPPAPPVPASWLPPAAARIHEAMGFMMASVLQDAALAGSARSVRGLGVSAGSYEGTARVLAGSHELSRVQPGDVLVAPSTGPAFNLVLPRLGAIVTDRGGLLSHAAIVAREFGIPAVVGCQDATLLVRDGARVRVDGATGTVSLL
jgi:phosphohistidine swiveling domain-containing protein